MQPRALKRTIAEQQLCRSQGYGAGDLILPPPGGGGGATVYVNARVWTGDADVSGARAIYLQHRRAQQGASLCDRPLTTTTARPPAHLPARTQQQKLADAFTVGAKGRFAFVGRRSEAIRAAGPHARFVDLAGRHVLPGLVDGRAHLIQGGLSMRGCGLRNLTTWELVARRVQAAAGESPLPHSSVCCARAAACRVAAIPRAVGNPPAQPPSSLAHC